MVSSRAVGRKEVREGGREGKGRRKKAHLGQHLAGYLVTLCVPSFPEVDQDGSWGPLARVELESLVYTFGEGS